MRLYRPVTDVGQSFVGCKIHTVPNQNLTLREIIKRFIRKESLPIEKQGTYNENLGDLEKLAKADIFERVERAKDLKEKIGKAQTRMKKKAADDKAASNPAPTPAPVFPPVPPPVPGAPKDTNAP